MNSRKKEQAKKTKQAEKVVCQGDLLRHALSWVIGDCTFTGLSKHGNVSWGFDHLAMLAILTAWSEATQLTAAFKTAAALSQTLFGVLAVKTFQGMMRALVTYSPDMVPRMWSRLQTLMEQVSEGYYRIGMWVPLAVDGSRFTTPRTEGNERAFAAKNFGKGRKTRSRKKWKNKKKRSKKLCAPVKPQIWLTLIWHMGLRLPWCWKTGPSTSSERHHFMDMLDTLIFPINTLFCADAGFVGYELWSKIIQKERSFLIRVGANVRLLKNLGKYRLGDGVVYLWPNSAVRAKQRPIMLRLIEVQSEKGRMFLVTNVLSERKLSTALLKRLYPLRWGIELQFRAVKQTFGRGKLRSRNPEHAIVELEWSLIALTTVQLLAIREQIKVEIPPERTSVAQAIAAIRHAIHSWSESETETLTNLLRESTKDSYQRKKSKSARYQPDYKDKPGVTKPIVVNASPKQKADYQAMINAA